MPETATAAPAQLPDDLWLPDDDDVVHWVMAGARQIEAGSSRYLAACGAEIELPPAADSGRMRAVLATVASGRQHRTCARIWRLRWQR